MRLRVLDEHRRAEHNGRESPAELERSDVGRLTRPRDRRSARQPTPESRNALDSFSISRAITSRWI
jgi:hypothetical protein